MNIKDFINLIAIILAFIASVLFCLGSLKMTPEQIKKQSIAYFGYNNDILEALVVTKVNYFIGALMLCISFIMQFFTNIPNLFDNNKLFETQSYAITVICILTISLCCLIYLYQRYKIKETLKQSKEIIA
ncbi:hypothetical protein GCM10009007_04670 [Formosimonas limnophila]|uniref:Uncharacterized protein n=1 Tax=Formosimonas limnophila TaxID=1384487 RepID=A0A8J3FYN6_9BURK|nr:hypothetical protein [Formosimonas limnophila]GHA67150.1 hypothetical protein GCM10009007_04670 [Formosimonas limnophila]